MMALSDLAVGTLGGEPMSFPAAHRDSNSTAITTTVVFTVPMSHEDVEAALWQLVRDEGVTFNDLADDRNARWLLLDSILGRGVTAIESYRMDLEALSPVDPAYPMMLRLRTRVEALIGPRPGRRRRPAGKSTQPASLAHCGARTAELTAAQPLTGPGGSGAVG